MEARPVEAELAESVGPVRVALLEWFDREARRLPWRLTRDPWAVLVSETMLQQTQVDRVIPKYEAFLAAFPTPRACAAAPVADVIRLWAGLGYNRRAVLLHRAAVQIAECHGGRVPSDLHQLMRLTGVGAYTARAVQVFAYEQDSAAVLDTNVGRVVARLLVGAPLTVDAAQQLVDSLVPIGDSWRWNQTLVEFGALVCRKRRPLCESCPVVARCVWRVAGDGSPDPCLGSAAVGRQQTTFVGSDRQGRGRLVAALRERADHTLSLDDADRVVGFADAAQVKRVIEGLIRDGLLQHSENGTVLQLAGVTSPSA